MTVRPLLAAIAAAFPLLAGAQTALTVYSSAQPGAVDPRAFRGAVDAAAVPGYAFVREDRTFALKRGRQQLRVTDVPAHIDPTTLSFTSNTDPQGTRVLAQSFEFDLTHPQKLLAKYLDREITVEQPRGQGIETFSGTLLSAQEGLTLRNPDGSVRLVSSYAGVKLPSLPGGLISKPTLVWDLEAAREGTHAARFTYQTGGMTWWTDYNLTQSDGPGGECRLEVGAWVTLVNQSGASYRDATLKLVAGDVQRAQPPRPQMVPAPAMAMRAQAKDEGFAEKAFFEYHLYTLGRPVNLPDNSTQQIELFPRAPSVGCEKALVYSGQAQPFHGYMSVLTDRGYGTQSNRKVDVHLRLRNSQSNGLGVPLPAGRIRVAKMDPADRSLEFIGEDVIAHTPRDETVQVRLGSAFDVVGERKQLDFRVDTNARWMEEDVEVRVRNRKAAETVTVLVRETMYRWSQWSITKKSHDFTRDDARTAHFPVKVAPGAEAVVRYTVRYTW
jgi:hypothetical protein